MKTYFHDYQLCMKGRRITKRPGEIIAHLACTECPAEGDLRLQAILPAPKIDEKFRQRGWSTSPRRCPDCIATAAAAKRTKGDTSMTQRPSVAAMKAQADMFNLLSQHFDIEKGRYAAGWSDAVIAEKTSLSLDMVAAFRSAGFGEIREPEEISRLRADINALEQLAREHHAMMVEQVAGMRSELAKLVKGGKA